MKSKNQKYQKSQVKNEGTFHPPLETSQDQFHANSDWKGYSDSQLKNMMLRLGVKKPENYTTRADMIMELEKITETINENE